jgi:hypothetical protein
MLASKTVTVNLDHDGIRRWQPWRNSPPPNTHTYQPCTPRGTAREGWLILSRTKNLGGNHRQCAINDLQVLEMLSHPLVVCCCQSFDEPCEQNRRKSARLCKCNFQIVNCPPQAPQCLGSAKWKLERILSRSPTTHVPCIRNHATLYSLDHVRDTLFLDLP